jgi:hypothetical protein
MRGISPKQLYELYIDAIQRCTSDLLNRGDEDIECELFEEFDIGAYSFLHEANLLRLREAGSIDDEVMSESKAVRAKWLDLQESARSVHDVRTREEWHELLRMCDAIRMKLSSGIESGINGQKPR